MKPRFLAIAALSVIVLGVVAAAAARPRVDPREIEAFVERAREGTRRYQDHQAAVDDGFTRVGAEFPAMGEHWVSFARIMEDSFAAERPAVLIYVSTDGGRRLAGAAYTRLLQGDSRLPAFPHASAWHEHNGAVDDESLPLRHGSHAVGAASDSSAPRLAILHAWIWNENPRGLFETDNWSLPLARHGIRADSRVPREAIQALALDDDRDGYLMLILTTTLDLAAVEESAAAEVVAAGRRRIAPIAHAVRAARRMDGDHSRSLSSEWAAMWTRLGQAIPKHRAEVAALRERM